MAIKKDEKTTHTCINKLGKGEGGRRKGKNK